MLMRELCAYHFKINNPGARLVRPKAYFAEQIQRCHIFFY